VAGAILAIHCHGDGLVAYVLGEMSIVLFMVSEKWDSALIK
jgi:hypothetical protein